MPGPVCGAPDGVAVAVCDASILGVTPVLGPAVSALRRDPRRGVWMVLVAVSHLLTVRFPGRGVPGSVHY